MESEALEIVNRFMSARGISLTGHSLQNCVKFAHVIMLMEKEAKLAKPSVRNCQKYAEGRVDAEFRISHATFYNDPQLNAMLKWFITTSEDGYSIKDNPNDVKNLESIIRRQKKQIQGLVASQQMLDSMSAELQQTKFAKAKSDILFKRAMQILRKYGKDFEVDTNILPEEIGFVSKEAYQYLLPGMNDKVSLEQGGGSECDVQDAQGIDN